MLMRSLTKIAYEGIVRERGVTFALADKYTNARKLIPGETKPFNSLIISQNITPINQLSYSFNFNEPGTDYLINIFGLIFISNLETAPIIYLPDDLKRDGFQIITFVD
jgi:hypothetical protein